MGQIKNLALKNIARTLIEKYPERFSTDFEKNKEELEKLVILESKKIRNMIAGYIVHLIRNKSRPKKFETLYQVRQTEKKRKRKR
jgi:small subunit ribosomal protein S17e